MTPEVIGAFGSAIVLILGSFFAFTKWVITKFLSELKPNGGGSIKDKVEVNSKKLEKIEERVDHIYEILAKKG
jgi:hypothetical protein